MEDFGIQKEKNYVSNRGKNLVFIASYQPPSYHCSSYYSSAFFSTVLIPAERNHLFIILSTTSLTRVKPPGGQGIVQFTTVLSVPRVLPGPLQMLDTSLLNE